MVEKLFENAYILTGPDLEPVHGFIRIVDGVIEEIGKGRPSKSGTDLGVLS